VKTSGKVDETLVGRGGNADIVEFATDQHIALGTIRIAVVDQQLQ
jgi:hypothetical protein